MRGTVGPKVEAKGRSGKEILKSGVTCEDNNAHLIEEMIEPPLRVSIRQNLQSNLERASRPRTQTNLQIILSTRLHQI